MVLPKALKIHCKKNKRQKNYMMIHQRNMTKINEQKYDIKIRQCKKKYLCRGKSREVFYSENALVKNHVYIYGILPLVESKKNCIKKIRRIFEEKERRD